MKRKEADGSVYLKWWGMSIQPLRVWGVCWVVCTPPVVCVVAWNRIVVGGICWIHRASKKSQKRTKMLVVDEMR